MSILRTLVLTVGVLSVFALVASACSSADDGPASDQPAAAQVADAKHLSTSGFRIDSISFQEKVRPYVRIPQKHTCLEGDRSPALSWNEMPAGTQSLALMAEDVDHHTGNWVHWVLYNIPADVTELPEAISTSTEMLPDGTTQGTNDHKNIGYNGPCPPPNIQVWSSYHMKPIDPPHRYYFRLYALDAELGLAAGATKAELFDAMEGHILAQANTMGKYQRPPAKKRPTPMSFMRASERPVPRTQPDRGPPKTSVASVAAVKQPRVATYVRA